MKKLAPLLLLAAASLHLAMLVGWRWQYPILPYFFDATVLSGGRGLDFYAIYQAGYNARHGVDIYENDPAKAPLAVPYFTPYRYLPIVAYTVGAALSLCASLTAYKIWLVIIELALLACVFFTWRTAPNRPQAMLLAAMWLGFTPFYLELFMGQFSLVQAALIFGMLLLATAAEARGAPSARQALGLESLWIASILWKINTFVFAPVFLRLRRFRVLGATALLGALVTLPYFWVFPAHALDLLRNNLGGSIVNHELGNLGFRQLIFEVGAALVLGLCLWLTFPLNLGAWLAKGRGASPASATAFARRPWTLSLAPSALLCLWLTAFFLVSPQIWEHHYIMLLPALVFTLRQAWDRPQAWWVFFIWLVIALPTPFGFIGLQPQIAANHGLRSFQLYPLWQPLLQHACKAVPTGLFFGYQVAGLISKKS